MEYDKVAVQWSIRWKLMAIITALMIALVAILTYVQISSQKEILEDALDRRTALMRENLIARGKAFISNLTDQVEDDIAGFDFSTAAETVKIRTRENREINYAVLMSSSGILLVHTLLSDPAQFRLTERDANALHQKDMTAVQYQEDDGPVIEIAAPIQVSMTPWGVLRLIYTLEHLDKEIEESRKQIRYKTKRMIFRSLLTSLAFMIICFVIVALLSAKFSEPIIHLTHVAKELSKGDFSASSDISIRSKDEVGVLTGAFIEMSRELENSYKKLEEYSKTLEQKVRERTAELHKSLDEVSEANQKIMASIRYAKMIQESFLPDMEKIKACVPDSFFVWKPKDIVGGDIFFTDVFKGGFVIAIIDCTGHGVPGALMTMIASAALKRIITDEGCHDPGAILKRLNLIVKTSLKQDTDQAISNDGLDAGICFVRSRSSEPACQPSPVVRENGEAVMSENQEATLSADASRGVRENGQTMMSESLQLIFAGAKTDLMIVHHNEANTVKGDKQSIGYKRSDLSFDFTNHTIDIGKGMSFYMTTDGFVDQLGGKKRFSFGRRRLQNLLKENAGLPFDEQENIMLQTFDEYKGKNERQDDVTVVGFKL